jgi:hypothetical protein
MREYEHVMAQNVRSELLKIGNWQKVDRGANNQRGDFISIIFSLRKGCS